MAGCSDDGDPAPTPSGPVVTADAVTGAFLKPSDLGQTWTVSDQSPPPDTIPPLCAGNGARPAVPGKPAKTSVSAADEGEKGAQTFDQVGLLYPDAGAAASARDALQKVVESCPPSVKVTPQGTSANPEAGYVETVQTTPAASGAWSGFAVLRHKQYEASSPGTADTAVVVLASRNVVLVVSYAVYRLDAPSVAPNFSADWQRLVGALVTRVEAKASPAK
jgi:hypothetical protein